MDATEASPEHFLGDYLFSESPANLLIVGPLPDVLLSRPVAGVAVHRLQSLHAAQALSTQSDSDTRSGSMIPASLVLQLSAGSEPCQERLGRAVRAFPHRVLVHVPVSEQHAGPDDDVFFSLGFRRLILMPGNAQLETSVRWFEYRLSHYKSAPEWLNARFWANPERFDTDEDLDDEYEESDYYEEE